MYNVYTYYYGDLERVSYAISLRKVIIYKQRICYGEETARHSLACHTDIFTHLELSECGFSVSTTAYNLITLHHHNNNAARRRYCRFLWEFYTT